MSTLTEQNNIRLEYEILPPTPDPATAVQSAIDAMLQDEQFRNLLANINSNGFGLTIRVPVADDKRLYFTVQLSLIDGWKS